jgi:peptidoglycan/LPS O-acetylase OafA/YrhL
VAALVVVVHHCVLTLPSLARQQQAPDPTSRAWWLTYTPLHLPWAGGEAVLVFFVLSGLVLTLPFGPATPAATWWAYYRKRLVRLYVPVAAAVVVTGVLVALVPRRADGGVSWWTAAHAVRPTVGALAHDALLLDGTGWLNSALWSLEYEVWFSLLLPVFVVVTRRLALPLWVSVPVALWGVGWAASIGHELLSYMFVFAVGALMAGGREDLEVWCGRISLSRRRRPAWAAVTAAGLALLLGEWWLRLVVSDRTLWLPVGRPVGVLGAAVVVTCCAWGPGRTALERRVPQWLGLVSFSLYLVHEPLVVSIATLTGPTPRGMLVTVLLGVPAALLAARGFHRWVERPSQRLASWAGRPTGRRRAASRGGTDTVVLPATSTHPCPPGCEPLPLGNHRGAVSAVAGTSEGER